MKAEDIVPGLVFVKVEHSGLEFRQRRLAPVDLQELYEFFLERQKGMRGFRFKDWNA